MGLFGGSTKVSKAQAQSESGAAAIDATGWTVTKKQTSLFNLAVIGSGVLLYWYWKNRKKGKG